MPRLRYKRSYDFTLYEQNDEEMFSESSSGSSWLSNAAIASQLSDSKIKAAISSLKAQITVLEAELLSRRLTGNRQTTKKAWAKIGDAYYEEDTERVRSPKRNKKATSRDSSQYQFAKVASLRRTLAKLGVKDVDALLKEWSKLNERKSDEK